MGCERYSILPEKINSRKKLSNGAKILYANINSLAYEKGYAWASNRYFSEVLAVDARTIQRWLKMLVDENLVSVRFERSQDGYQVLRRLITIVEQSEKVATADGSPSVTASRASSPERGANAVGEVATVAVTPHDTAVTPPRQNCHPLTTELSPPHDKTVVYNNKKNNKKNNKLLLPVEDDFASVSQEVSQTRIPQSNPPPLEEGKSQEEDDLKFYALEVAKEQGAKDVTKYANKILANWRDFGISRVEQVKPRSDKPPWQSAPKQPYQAEIMSRNYTDEEIASAFAMIEDDEY